ncbi:MAG: LapA family protein [Clostridiales bacterium]|nr:LapA family protein [Clostridiales bacterium]
MQLTYILALLFALVVAIFALLNAQPVTVDFIFNEFQISLALVILVSAFAGAIILGFLGIFRQVKGSFKSREMNARIKKLEEQLKETVDKNTKTELRLAEAEAGIMERDNRIKELEGILAERENGETKEKE